jgi:HK97 family phage major capsid protein
VSFTTIAAMATISRFLLEDFADGAFMTFLPRELNAAVVDEENSQILLGDGDSPNMRGLLNTSGALTRPAVLSSSPSITEIDVLMSAANDLNAVGLRRCGFDHLESDRLGLHPEAEKQPGKLHSAVG